MKDSQIKLHQELTGKISELRSDEFNSTKAEALALAKGIFDTVFFAEYWLGLKLNSFQKRYFARIDEEDRKGNFIQVVCPTANQVGKANPISEPVLTPVGWKKMGDIKIGDEVISQDGLPTKVIGVFPQGEKKIYRLTFDDGSWSRCTAEHLWSVITPYHRLHREHVNKKSRCKNLKYRQYDVMTTNEIIKHWGNIPSVVNRVEIPMVAPVDFSYQQVPIDPYTLGVLIGDGSFTNGVVNLTTADKEIIGNIKVKSKKKKGKYSYGIYGLQDSLRQLGLMGKHSWKKFIPDLYLWNNQSVRLEILKGLMDTDGTVDKRGWSLEYCTTSPELADNVKFIVQSLGGKCEIKERFTYFTYKGVKKRGRKSYRVIIKIGINIFKLSRKHNLVKFVNRTHNRILYKIEDDGYEESQCILIDNPSHLYVVRDFIVTHNSLADAILHIKWSFYKKGMELDGDSFEKTFYQTLNLSPVIRQTKVCMQYVEQILTSTFNWVENKKSLVNRCRINSFLKGKNENMGRIEYANNSASFFVSTGEDQAANIQGAQFGMITYDECCLSLHLKDELPSKIFSRLAKYGNLLVLIASPKSEERSNSQQYFYHLSQDAKKGLNDFIYISGVFDENIFIPKEQRDKIKERLKKLDPNAYREVVYGDFISSSTHFFPSKIIEAVWNGKDKHSSPIPERKYVAISDWGFAEQGDKSVFAVFDYTDHPKGYELVYGYEEKGGDPWRLATQFILLCREFNDSKSVIDAGAMGGNIMKKSLRELHPIPFYGQEQKIKSLEKLFLLLTEPSEYGIAKVGKIKSYYIANLESELASYKTEDKKLEQDWVMVLTMFAYFVKNYLVNNNKKTLISTRARFNSLHNVNRN